METDLDWSAVSQSATSSWDGMTTSVSAVDGDDENDDENETCYEDR